MTLAPSPRFRGNGFDSLVSAIHRRLKGATFWNCHFRLEWVCGKLHFWPFLLGAINPMLPVDPTARKPPSTLHRHHALLWSNLPLKRMQYKNKPERRHGMHEVD